MAPPTSRAGRRVGVYQIIEEIGHGGMGEVYRAVRADGQYTKEVAVKLVRGGFDYGVSCLERFRNERQILASLDHPNIARLLDGGTTDDGVPYLVMELIEGMPIDQYCDRTTFPSRSGCKLFRQVCGAVQYAHQTAGHPSRYQAEQHSGDGRGRAEAARFWDCEDSGSGGERARKPPWRGR